MTLKELEEKTKTCNKCNLSQGRTNVVPGEGNSTADIMFIGEGPGKNEDEQGRPFVGAAGKFLTELIESINLTRQDVYIANVVKCRPPNNRDPLPQEVKACWPWLEQQITIIKPKVIVTLGRHSLARFLPAARISSDHGRALRKQLSSIGKIVFFPSYHPAAALYNGGLRETIMKDFQKIPKVLDLIEQGAQSLKDEQVQENDNKTKQQSLF
jgi:uracil-DNA glycosylase